jgi:hypothetical protein
MLQVGATKIEEGEEEKKKKNKNKKTLQKGHWVYIRKNNCLGKALSFLSESYEILINILRIVF